MEIIEVNQNNIHLLHAFIGNLGAASQSFRYYNSRTTESIRNHLTTLLMVENNEPVAYGHLDVEKEVIWLGICVLPQYYRKGYGLIMMNELIGFARKSNIPKIYLTVDKHNTIAMNLYRKFNFRKESENEQMCKYSLSITEE